MATLLPPDQMEADPGPEDVQGFAVQLDEFDEDPDIIENEDGSATVKKPDVSGPADDSDFYENLALVIPEYELTMMANKQIDLIEKDQRARKERDKQYEEGIRRTGMGKDAPGGATFMGASKVVHPAMAEACIDFESRAIKELFPADGPVRTNLPGKADNHDIDRAQAKRDFMNWQCTSQMPEFKDEEEVLLTQLPLGGSQYLNMWYDSRLKRPCSEFIPIDNIFLPFACNNFYTAQRVTHQMDISEYEFEERVASGLYREIDVSSMSMEPEPTASEKANRKIEGKKFEENIDHQRRVYHQYVFMKCEYDKKADGEYAPYILMMDKDSSTVLGMYRNWEEDDDTLTKLDWIIEFKFVPWRGAYAVGLPHLAGGLVGAATGALRALLDTAHVNNAATMLKLKGAKMSGQSQQVDVTQITEIEGAPGVDDIRKIAMPMPFNPPSPVLFQLLGWLTDAAKGIITTSEEKIADVTSSAPVGTTQALIEQGATVFAAIHSRLHDSQKRVLQVLSRINKWYLDEMKLPDSIKKLNLTREEFSLYDDVLPVSDPNIFSETQRMAQTQAVIALMDKYPDEFNKKAVVSRMIKQIKVPNSHELMPVQTDPEERNAADENTQMALGRAAYAYPHQDQLGHISTHLDFALNPALGGNPIIAPTYLPLALDHLKQHILMWYTANVNKYVEGTLKKPIEHYESPAITKEIDKLIAVASQHTSKDTASYFAKVIPAIQQLQKSMQAYAPKPQLSGDDQVYLQTQMAETQRKAERDKEEIALNKMKQDSVSTRDNRAQQIQIALDANDKLTQERIATAELTHDARVLQHEQQKTALDALQNAQATLGAPNGQSGQPTTNR